MQIEERGNRRAGRVVEEGPEEALQRGAAGLLGFGRWRVDVAGAVVLSCEQPTLDHDVEQFANARRCGRIRQLGADLLDRGAAAPMEDLHNLAFAPGEMNRSELL